VSKNSRIDKVGESASAFSLGSRMLYAGLKQLQFFVIGLAGWINLNQQIIIE